MIKKTSPKKNKPTAIKVAEIGLIGTVIAAGIGTLGLIINSTITAAQNQYMFEAETMVAKATSSASIPQTSQPQTYKYPIPKINPLPNSIAGKIAFFRAQGNNENYIIANSDDSNEMLIVKANWSIACPRIAPGGEKMVFDSAYEGRGSVYVINQDGSNLKRLTDPSTAAHEDGCASWSPDGSRIIYARQYSISNDIYAMNSNGEDQKNLTNIFSLGTPPSSNSFSEFPWSPDGQRIVFDSNRGGFYKLYIMDENGGNLVQITKNLGIEEYGAVWAPNRNEIAYVSTGGLNNNTDIFTLNLDDPTAKPINITNNQYHNTEPVWSPDGTQILFVSNRDGNSDLYIMNSDGSDVRQITDTPEPESNPSWLR